MPCLPRRAAAVLVAALAVALPLRGAGAQPALYEERGAAALARTVDGLGQTARVLVVGAHPDDEDTRLIAWLAKTRHAETAYLSLTRGDGGQNLIGNELGEALGAIRTEELLAARRLDGGSQYFSRAYDFGFSKSAEETFRHWPRDSVLGDVVRVVRSVRPHVLIAIFGGTPADGHGHHQASGILAREAYDAAADTARFPAAGFGPAWTVAKFYRNTSYRNHAGATLRYDAGAYDPWLGRSPAELAMISRTQHKSQGQGRPEVKGPSIVSLQREATRVAADVAAEREGDLFAGLDTAWTRLRAAVPAERRATVDSLAAALAAVRPAYDPWRPEGILRALARAERLLDAACGGARGCDAAGGDLAATRDVTIARLHRAVQLAAGLELDAQAPREHLVVGRPVPATVTLHNRGARAARVTMLQLEGSPDAPALLAAGETPTVAPGAALTRTAPVVPRRLTGPWWLVAPRTGATFAIGGGAARREEWREIAAFDAIAGVEVDGAYTVVEATGVRRTVDAVRGELARPAAAVPAIAVALDEAVAYAPAGAPIDRMVRVRLTSADTASRAVTVRLALPAGLAADSAARGVTLAGYDAQATVSFRVRGRLAPGRHALRAEATSEGERFESGYRLVDYEHVRPQPLWRTAETAIVAVDVALPPRLAVGYLPGVGDNVAPMLAQLGVPVTVLDPATLASADLSRFTALVVGPRAYEAHPALVAANARLLDWARAGGTLVVQYGQYEMTQPGVMPHPVTLDRPAQRVTLEEAPVTVLDATARVLATPNRIGPADWAGWVQERALYMPATADSAYRPVVALHDPGEPENRNALLVAPLGRGTYVYTTLSLFRQLPAGNPGAARLFVNLLAARADAVAVRKAPAAPARR